MIGDTTQLPQDWLDSILQTIMLKSPNFAGLRGRALSAPGNLGTSANAPVTAGVGPMAQAEAAGTGPVVTANPQPTATAAPAATAAPSGSPAGATPAGQAGAPASSVGQAPPALNSRTVNEVWRAMSDYNRGQDVRGGDVTNHDINVSGGGTGGDFGPNRS